MESHGAFFLPHITDDMSILDCGFGPGTITCDIAERVPRGKVVGVDVDESQVRVARENADKRGTRNVEFRHGSAYELPFQADSFGAVFTHALLEHLSEPARAVEEFRRVLRPGGILATCSPDWGGFLIVPQSHSLSVAIEAYKSLQVRNGGDVYVGRKLSAFFEQAGFENINMRARYEVYESLGFIGEYLATQLQDAGEAVHAATLRDWANEPTGMFAQAWVSCIGQKASIT